MKLPDGSYSGQILNRMCVSCREHTEKDDPSVTCCSYHVLSNEPDFMSQKSWLSETAEKYPGCQLIFYPKFHCELNFIEMVWAWAKAHHRSTCTYKYNDLKTGLPGTFDELMPISFGRHLIIVYVACTVTEADLSVLSLKKYESHRRLSPTIRLDEIASEFEEKKAKKMTFKRCK